MRDFVDFFGFSIDDAYSNLEKRKAKNEAEWQDVLDGIDNSIKSQSTKERLEWRVELNKRKKMIENINSK